jgi:hypothetical protein
MFNKIKDRISGIVSELNYRVSLLRHRHKLPALPESDRQILSALKQEGAYVTKIADLELASTSKLLKAVNSYLAQFKRVNHEDFGEKLPEIYTITDFPEIAAWGKEPKLLNIIENYIGLPVSFHGVHLRKDFPTDHQFNTLLWHQDAEDRRIIKIFVYLEDVEAKHGPFEYIPKSLISFWDFCRVYYQLWRSRYLGINDQEVAKIIPKSAWKSCPGSAGTVLFADTKILFHHGTLRTEPRSTLFFCYTSESPKRPEICTQYWDDTYPKLELTYSSK